MQEITIQNEIICNTIQISVKPTVRVSPIVSSSTSPSSQHTDRQTNGQTNGQIRTQPASTSSSVITSSNGTAQQRAVVQSSEAQSSGTPAHAVIPTSSINSEFISFFGAPGNYYINLDNTHENLF